MMNAVIINPTIVNIFDDNCIRFDLYCNESQCWIRCYSNNSCSNLYLHCFASCFVACDINKGIQCPMVVVGNYSDWVGQQWVDENVNNFSNNSQIVNYNITSVTLTTAVSEATTTRELDDTSTSTQETTELTVESTTTTTTVMDHYQFSNSTIHKCTI